MGEQWSPQTAPAMQADMERISILVSTSWKMATTIGIKIPKVPQEVPVAKARPMAIRKINTGRKDNAEPALLFTITATNSFAPKLSVIAFKDQAKDGRHHLLKALRQAVHSFIKGKGISAKVVKQGHYQGAKRPKHQSYRSI